MKVFIVLLAALFVANAAETPELFIHGGGHATRNAFPFLVSIQQRFIPNLVHICSGVIVNSRWVLTAGDCADSISRLTVVAGRHDLQSRDETEQRRTVLVQSSIISADGHLALLHLASAFIFDNVTSPAQLDQNNIAIQEKEALFAGWNFRPAVSTERTQILRSTTFRVMADSDCKRTLVSNEQFNSETDFCTTSMSGIMSGDIAACNGNMGSPFFVGERTHETVMGLLIDHPRPCDAQGQPTGHFARVSRYMPWINAIVSQ